MRPLQRRWRDSLSELLQAARSDVLIASPFVTQRGVSFLSEHLPSSFKAEGRLAFLTDLSARNVVQRATDPEALQDLAGTAAEITLYHLPRLHAKVYLADDCSAIITSGNLTEGGLRLNFEYGVSVADATAVVQIRKDIESYASLGALLKLEQLSAYSEAAEEARVAFGDQQRSTRRSARKVYEEALGRADIELLKLRVAGDSVHSILSKTILYLLQREGPLSTAEMHPLVQALHPDICDDEIERVIDGERFGKKWKHWVRTAQAMLKRQGQIELIDGKWQLL
jgi:hypothetical protein